MQPSIFHNARFLIVDDEKANVSILKQMLEEWGVAHICTTNDPRTTVDLLHAFEPDIILLDLMMPHLNGFEVMQQLQPFIAENDFLPILVLTADNTSKTKRSALESGATDFLTKPFDAIELSLRAYNLLARRLLHRRLLDQKLSLEQQVQQRTGQLVLAEINTVECLAIAGEYRDDDTGQHTKRVGRLSALLAGALGLGEQEVTLIGRAAPLHDVGKIGIPDSILLKPGKLTADEFAVMKTHTSIGSAILARQQTVLLHHAADIALMHHERWDGTGYPAGLAGEEIALSGRIVAVADVFDALTHERPYKQAWPLAKAVAEIVSQSGSQFDAEVVKAFLTLDHQALN